MRISEIVKQYQAEGLLVDFFPGERDQFDRAEFDSREIGPNTCFVAIRGHEADGHAFIDKAVKNGAVAIVYEAAPEISREGLAGAACVHVHDSRVALLRLASMQAGFPADRLKLVGTTGTNGKTTVATLVQHLLTETGTPCGFIGTTGYSVGSITYEARETTPSPVRVYSLLAEMEGIGSKACSMEVSSHALDQCRVEPSDFDVGVFTNLTHDHLDYHKSEGHYLGAKKRLFDGLDAQSTAVVNADDASSNEMTRDTHAALITYGASSNVDVRYKVEREDVTGLLLKIDGIPMHTRMAGYFNAGNMAATYAVGLGLEIPSKQIIHALETAPAVSGRFEIIRGSDDRTVIIDYAHTPDALENILSAARRITPKGAELWCVFGCGGDRDAQKRPIMGKIAERVADHVIVTSDNPRSEPPESIMEDIKEGMERPDKEYFFVDRLEAIAFSAKKCGPGSVIVVAGKGHESNQVIGSETRPFDDGEEARRAFDAEAEIKIHS